MAISNLRDIRTEIRDYLDNQVQVEVKTSPDQGKDINEGNTFTIKFTVENSPGQPLKKIRLINVRYHLRVQDPQIAELSANSKDYDILFGASDNLLLKPKDPAFAVLGAFGQLATLKPPSITGTALKKGETKIVCHIHADPDLDFLFPNNETSSRGVSDVVVLEKE